MPHRTAHRCSIDAASTRIHCLAVRRCDVSCTVPSNQGGQTQRQHMVAPARWWPVRGSPSCASRGQCPQAAHQPRQTGWCFQGRLLPSTQWVTADCNCCPPVQGYLQLPAAGCCTAHWATPVRGPTFVSTSQASRPMHAAPEGACGHTGSTFGPSLHTAVLPSGSSKGSWPAQGRCHMGPPTTRCSLRCG